MTSIVLVGGKSLRLGRAKIFANLCGKSLIQWVVDRLASLSTEIIIVTGQNDQFASYSLRSELGHCTMPRSTLRMRMICDIYPNKGPLGGIYSGLVASSCWRSVVVGSDMPFLNTALLAYMCHSYSAFDIVVPRTRKGIEPLSAIYSKNCLVPIRSLLEGHDLKISKLFNITKAKYVEEDEIDRFDPEHLSFFNINSEAELLEANQLTIKEGC